MQTLAIVVNVLFAGFTGLVTITDGAPEEAFDVVLTIFWMMIPLASAVVIWRARSRPGRSAALVTRAALVANVLSLDLAAWAMVKAYSHPAEEGLVACVVLLAATPILSVNALLRGKAAGRPLPAA